METEALIQSCKLFANGDCPALAEMSATNQKQILTFDAFKRSIFILEGLNGFGSTFYCNYLFFYLNHTFGFGNKGNLAFCAINGFLYIFGSLYGGKFAQKHGYLNALQLGLAILTASLCLALVSQTPLMHLLALCLWTGGICFTWPTLEALTCEGESGRTLPRKVGIYNIVWSGAQAAAYFSGGAIIKVLGWNSIFIIPAVIHIGQFFIVRYLARNSYDTWHELPGAPEAIQAEHEGDPEKARRFLRMAWFANPFAYIAMNTIIPLIPDVAARLQLSPMAAGFFCSIWMFARMTCFWILWHWTAWHYRFKWLITSYVFLVISFAGILLITNLWGMALMQIIFGFSAGLIYYSSLFYSMDASDTKGEHGGVHEAAIGAGLFGGPAIGLAALYLFPGVAHSSVYAVSAILSLGLGGLFFLRKR